MFRTHHKTNFQHINKYQNVKSVFFSKLKRDAILSTSGVDLDNIDCQATRSILICYVSVSRSHLGDRFLLQILWESNRLHEIVRRALPRNYGCSFHARYLWFSLWAQGLSSADCFWNETAKFHSARDHALPDPDRYRA